MKKKTKTKSGASVGWISFLRFEIFDKAMWERIKTFGYPKSIDQLKIQTSELTNSAILGAAALFYDTL